MLSRFLLTYRLESSWQASNVGVFEFENSVTAAPYDLEVWAHQKKPAEEKSIPASTYERGELRRSGTVKSVRNALSLVHRSR